MSDSIDVLLVDEHEAGRLVGLSAATLRRDRKDGRLGIEFIKMGAAVRYSPAALAAWVAARLVATAPPPAAAPPRRPGRPRKTAPAGVSK